MHAINVGKWNISRGIARYDGDKPSDSRQEQDRTFDSYDPVVGKWMTNFGSHHSHHSKGYEKSVCQIK